MEVALWEDGKGALLEGALPFISNFFLCVCVFI